MKIAFFAYEYPPYKVGGLGTYTEYITRELIKLGHDITVFSMHTKDAPTRDLYKGVEVHRPIVENMNINIILPIFMPQEILNWSDEGQKYFGSMFLYNLLSASKLVNDLVRSENREIDLISAHDWLGSLGGSLASRGLKKPLVFHIHSTEQGRAGNGSPTVKRLERSAINQAQRVITVSYAMRDHLVRLGYDEKKIRVVYNGIDTDIYSPNRVKAQEIVALRQKLGIHNDEFMILFVGRLNWVKGADMLLQSMPHILKQVPKTKLVIVGVGDQQEMLRQDVSKFGLTNKIILKYEFLQEHEKIKYYAASDVCVFPSKYEPFGIVCTEALALGKPVVVGASGISGLREQVIPVGPNQCGFHINPYDPSDIATYVVALLEDDELRKKCSQNARRRVEDLFNWQKIAEETMRVYHEVV